MKLAFMIGPTCVGDRPFSFDALETSPRGLTGTDGSFLNYARAMSQRGHGVTLYVDQARDTTWDGCRVRPWFYRREIDSTTDAVCCWVDVHGLRWVPQSCVRMLNMQLNNFDFARGPWLDYVDLFVAPSRSLLDRLHGIAKGVGGTWEVLPNGCDPNAYEFGKKVPGRCIYTSSPDRGLHVLLQQWPRIKAAVPHATLKIFYHNLERWIENIDVMSRGQADMPEQARRASIIRDSLGLAGVERVGSVSRQQMAREYSEAEVLAYPCDTIAFTEGFASSVLEGCAAGTVPVITDADAFGSVYDGVCPMIQRGEGWENRWGDLAIEMLRDANSDDWRDGCYKAAAQRGYEFAARHAWPVLAERLEALLTEQVERKRAA